MNLCSGVVFDTDDECVFLVLCQVGCRYKIKKALIVVVFYQYEVRKNQIWDEVNVLAKGIEHNYYVLTRSSSISKSLRNLNK